MTDTIGVLGAGTMGAGIAQVALTQGFQVRLYDVSEAGLERACLAITSGLQRLVDKGQLTPAARDRALASLVATSDPNELAPIDLAIEAAPESLGIKQALFTTLEAICRRDTILASNTSSLSITAIAGALSHPERVVGMHFFNPAPRMALVEVVAGHLSSPDAVKQALAYAERLGKQPVMAKDTPGFILNRVARPFYGEALQIVGEGMASVETVDRVMRRAGGFRMGPFELMDLIGIDVNFAVTQSVYEAFFQEPRFRPHPIQRRMVEAGLLGRKSGKGFYDHDGRNTRSGEAPPPTGAPSQASHRSGPHAGRERLAIVGEGHRLLRWADWLASAGHEVLCLEPPLPLARVSEALAECAGLLDVSLAAPIAREKRLRTLLPYLAPGSWVATTELTSSATALMAATGAATLTIGDWAPPWESGLLEIAPAEGLDGAVRDRALACLGATECEVTLVGDQVGLVFARSLAMIINEAAFALQEGVASAVDLDLAMQLGANYPRGPLAWADEIGPARIVVLLDSLGREFGDPRYRVSPCLRRLALRGLHFHDVPSPAMPIS